MVAAFDGGRITSDAGAILLGATDRVIGLTRRLAVCFTDARNPAFVEHAVETLVMQRNVGIALGYEDLIDHDELRHDPVLSVLAGKLAARRGDCAPLAGKSTLNRLKLSGAVPTRYGKLTADAEAFESLFVDVFLDARGRPPAQITLDLDATDDPLHGHQEGRFFHGYYDCYCYLPLYVFCGRHLLAAKLRRSNIDAAAGSVDEIKTEMADARLEAEISGKPARRFRDFAWSTLNSWSRARRVIGKAEWTGGEANPRFVVTSLRRHDVAERYLYETIYCARGEMEISPA